MGNNIIALPVQSFVSTIFSNFHYTLSSLKLVPGKISSLMVLRK